MVPSWVPSPIPPATLPDSAAPLDGDGQGGSLAPNPNAPPPATQPAQIAPVAPAGRFSGARKSLGSFASGGDKKDMRRGVREYVRKGYGGKATALKRFGGTISTADTLYSVLGGISSGQTAGSGSPLDPTLLAGKSAREVMDAVVEAVRPVDGTQDAEANRAAVKASLSELLTLFPDADLLNLTEDQRVLAIEKFVALDVYQRLALDIGKTIQDRAPTVALGFSRLKEVREYIKQTVAASFRKLRTSGNTVTSGKVKGVVQAALDGAFHVFEEWVR
jgi:hypothetical protein